MDRAREIEGDLAEARAGELLREYFDPLGAEISACSRSPLGEAPDLIAKIPRGPSFAVEVSTSNSAGALETMAGRLADFCTQGTVTPDSFLYPIVVVPFMSPAGRRLCDEQKVGWFDLSGNADIRAPGIRILISGKKNQFKRPGPRWSTFAPKSSRIARWLLMYADTGWSQKQLSEKTGLEKGYVSKVVRRMKGEGLVQERSDGFRPYDPDTLLNVWETHYNFSKHRIIKGTYPARTSEDAVRQISRFFKDRNVDHAATGLAGAWFVDHFSAFSISTFYLAESPSAALLKDLGFHEEERGANVWLVVPNDEGVFQGRGEDSNVPTVHPVQIYLDLKGHPERSKEAAEHLRRAQLNWRKDER